MTGVYWYDERRTWHGHFDADVLVTVEWRDPGEAEAAWWANLREGTHAMPSFGPSAPPGTCIVDNTRAVLRVSADDRRHLDAAVMLPPLGPRPAVPVTDLHTGVRWTLYCMARPAEFRGMLPETYTMSLPLDTTLAEESAPLVWDRHPQLAPKEWNRLTRTMRPKVSQTVS